jgi:hypothetical protein
VFRIRHRGAFAVDPWFATSAAFATPPTTSACLRRSTTSRPARAINGPHGLPRPESGHALVPTPTPIRVVVSFLMSFHSPERCASAAPGHDRAGRRPLQALVGCVVRVGVSGSDSFARTDRGPRAPPQLSGGGPDSSPRPAVRPASPGPTIQFRLFRSGLSSQRLRLTRGGRPHRHYTRSPTPRPPSGAAAG